MQITYRLLPQDLSALADCLPSVLPAIGKSERSLLLSIGTVWLFGAGFLWVGTKAILLVVAWVLLAIIALPFAPAGLRGTRRKNLAAYYSRPENGWVFEPETLRIEPEGLFAEGVRGNRMTRWQYIDRVSFSDGYLFISPRGTTEVWIVPEQRVTAGDVEAFAKEAGAYWRSAGVSGISSDEVDRSQG